MNFKAGATVAFGIGLVHFNKSEWQRPYEFLPQRFDNEDELSLTPEGTKRHPFSFIPFSGGNRICFGKTFAEAKLKIVATYLSQMLDFEFVDKQYGKKSMPLGHFCMSSNPAILMRVTKRKQEAN